MRALLGRLVFLVALASCSPSRQWPDQNVNTLKLTENGVAASAAVAEVATVEKDRLVFPASAADEVKAKWTPGKSVVGGPSSAAGTTNPLGFIRKVKEVRVEGEQVIVETEPTTIDQIFDGKLVLTTSVDDMTSPDVPDGVDLEKYLPEFPTGPATPYPDDPDALGVTTQPLLGDEPVILSPIGVKRQPIDISPGRIDVPTVPIVVPVGTDRPIAFSKTNGMLATARMQYRGRFTLNPKLSLTPRLRVELETKNCPFCDLESFLFSVGGSITAGIALDADVVLAPHPDDVRGFSAADLAALDDAVNQQPVQFTLPEVLIGKKNVKKVGSIYGVPVLMTTGVYGDCQFQIRGRYKGDLNLDLSNPNFVVGVKYQDSGPKKDRWAPVTPDRFTVNGSARVISANGSIEVECGVTLKSTLTMADLAGPYAGLRNNVVGTVEIADTACPASPGPNVRKTGTLTPSIKAFTSFEVGAEVTLLKIISFGVGPYSLAKQLYKEGPLEQLPDELVPATIRALAPGAPFYARKHLPLWTGPKVTFNRAGFCPSPCNNGRKDATETDLDCGGMCGANCTRGSACTANGDCASMVCSGGTCRGGLADDSLKNQGETDIDCGGPTTPARCDLGSLCAANSDCGVGFCGKTIGNERRCTENLCLDGVQSGGESDADCGAVAGCTTLCTLGQGCRTAGDCTTAACSINGLCVSDTCVDGIKNGTEADIDCGGTCARKCVVGDSCQPSTETDCASGICSASTSSCVTNRCEDGRTNQSESDIDCGGFNCAARCGVTAHCRDSSDCQPNTVCNAKTGACSLPGCDDGIKNGQESSIDCGGPTCLKCAISKACLGNGDCVTGTCTQGRCVGGPCENELRDPGEADVDCGGTCGRPCNTGKACTAARDCATNLCVNSVCSADACKDLVRNGAETDADCGGTTCAARCALGAACVANADCGSNLCNQVTRRCVATTCSDGVLTSASESDVDCGSTCASGNATFACAVNKRCAANADCASGVCNATTLRCVPDTCFNGVKDGTESDLDCGGSCDPKCGGNQACRVGADCRSGTCNAGVCAADQCSNLRLDGNETDLDCGGTCSTKCALSKGCLVGADCANPQGMMGVDGFCALSSRTCVATSCNTGVKDGTETGVDCGGGCGTCGNGQGCGANGDCTSGICNLTTRVCVATQCEDGVKNGTETDIDCGGNTCGGTCAVNKACVRPWDCQSGYCGSTNLCIPTYPRSCTALYYSGQPNTQTDGLYVIDPDGPTPRTTGPERGGADKGMNKPFLTFCKMDQPSGFSAGWTPIVFMNSQGVGIVPDLTLTSTAGVGTQLCSFGSTCSIAGEVCLDNAGGAACSPTSTYCHCEGPSLWVNGPSLPGNPASFSVDTGSNVAQQRPFTYATGSQATPYVGFTGGGPYPTNLRWTGYRNGVLVFDAVFPNSLGAEGWATQGQYRASNMSGGIWDWCNAGVSYVVGNGVETTNYSPPSNDLDASGLRTSEGKCRRFGRNLAQQFGLSTLSSGLFVNNVMRVLPQGNNNLSAVNGQVPVGTTHVGMWVANYGSNNTTYRFPSAQVMPQQLSMGFCNGMSSATDTTRQTPCNPFRHPPVDGNGNAVTFSWGATELSGDATRGSEFGARVPGLVFVLWAQ